MAPQYVPSAPYFSVCVRVCVCVCVFSTGVKRQYWTLRHHNLNDSCSQVLQGYSEVFCMA